MIGGRNINMNKGVTLIEMMVAVVIFSLISGAAVGIFVSALRIQKYSLTSQKLLDQTSYATEYMSRFLRMAKKNEDKICGGMSKDKNYKITQGGKGIKFVNSKRECLEFFWDTTDNQLRVNKWEEGGTKVFNAVELTSNDFKIVSFNFNISGDQPGDESQPRVTMFMEIEGKTTPLPKIKIQTTVSQRNLDI